MTVRIVLVDDHPVVRAGLSGILSAEPDFEIVGEADDGEEAVRLALECEPDLVLMDLYMPKLDGIAATAQIAMKCPAVPVLILTTYDSRWDVVRAIEAGAAGFILKDTPRVELVQAVRSVLRGETVLGPQAAQVLADRLRAPRGGVTAREIEVLTLVAKGLNNAAIGRELFISEATVKTHLVRVFGKLGVDDRTAAVTAAIRYGILPRGSA